MHYKTSPSKFGRGCPNDQVRFARTRWRKAAPFSPDGLSEIRFRMYLLKCVQRRSANRQYHQGRYHEQFHGRWTVYLELLQPIQRFRLEGSTSPSHAVQRRNLLRCEFIREGSDAQTMVAVSSLWTPTRRKFLLAVERISPYRRRLKRTSAVTSSPQERAQEVAE